MSRFKDLVKVSDAGFARLRTRLGKVIAGQDWDTEKSVVEAKGWVTALLRERGKIVPGSRREGHNVWTNTGREFNALLQTLEVAGSPGTAYRNDRIAYIGVGTGSQVEDPEVTRLIQPAAFEAGSFLANIDIPSTSFPLLPSKTTVRYFRTFTESELTIPGVNSSINIKELGLFTNGRQSDFEAGQRDTSLSAAALQSPVAYKNLQDPVTKTENLEFEVAWEIRF